MKLKQFFNSPDRWVQNTAYKYEDNKIVACCLVGAIGHCYKNRKKGFEAMDKLDKYINSSAHCRVEAYNDKPYRTFEDIKRLVTKLDI